MWNSLVENIHVNENVHKWPCKKKELCNDKLMWKIYSWAA